MCCMLEGGHEEVLNYSFSSGFLGLFTTTTEAASAGVNPARVMFVLINSS